MEYKISINQLADFAFATEARKKSIIKQQKKPNPFLIPWYQLAKSKIKQSIISNGDFNPIDKGIKELKSRNPEKKRQIIDKQVSMEALRIFKEIKLPELLKDIPFEIIKTKKIKSIYINGVKIIISPDVIYKINIGGQKYIGGVKLHVAKGNIFETKQLKYISSLIYEYLDEIVANEDEIVMKELCLYLDIFGKRVISAPKNNIKSIKTVHRLCGEIKMLWNIA
jgi:hypothetical protein